jgi:hypothetical protein
MAVGPSQKIAQTISTSSGGAIHAVIPIQKRNVLAISIVDLLVHGRRSAQSEVSLRSRWFAVRDARYQMAFAKASKKRTMAPRRVRKQ